MNPASRPDTPAYPSGRPAHRRARWRRLTTTLLAICGWSLAAVGLPLAADSALADTAVSSNWSGYAVHRSGVHFKKISARWRQPHASCTNELPTYSATWVGIGGYSSRSSGLEQIGTELDCHNGVPVSSAWYEVLPAASTPTHMTVRQGDLMSATVVLSGHEVSFTLKDLTSRHTFSDSMHATTIDNTSAEWIVEAPSACQRADCYTLPLANFGNLDFDRATVTSVSGHRGSITNPEWKATKIRLMPNGPRFVYAGGRAGAAMPSVLSALGNAFSIAYESYQPKLQPAVRTVRVASLRATARSWVPLTQRHHALF